MDLEGFRDWLSSKYSKATTTSILNNLKLLNERGINPDTTTTEQIREIYWYQNTKQRNYRIAAIRKYKEFLEESNGSKR